MKNPEFAVLILLFAHYVADYIFQFKNMATKKSTDNMWLFTHIGTYWAALLIVLLFFFGNEWWNLLLFVTINTILHGITDYYTSRWGDYFRESAKVATDLKTKDFHDYMYWKVLGFDQLIHMSILIVTYHFILK